MKNRKIFCKSGPKVWIFVSGTEGIHNESRVDALYNHRKALEQKRGL